MGKTAQELKITVVAHETNSFLAYESITRSHSGEPNVLISRKNNLGESALYGDGFYTRIGKEGARGTGLTIRFRVDPKAREGTDFVMIDDYIIFKNKRVLKVIQESLNFGIEDLLKLAQTNQNLQIDHSDLALLEKLKRKLNAAIINDELNKLLNSKSENDWNRLIQILSVFEETNIKKLISSEVLNSVVKNVYYRVADLPKSTLAKDWLRYIQTIGPIVHTLDSLNIIRELDFINYLKRLLDLPNTNFEFKKQVIFERILNYELFYESLKLSAFLTSEEIKIIQTEIESWQSSADPRKIYSMLLLNKKWSEALWTCSWYDIEDYINSGVVNINHRNFSNVSILQLAAYHKSSMILNKLIDDKNFDFNAKNKQGYTEVEQLLLIGKSDFAKTIMKARPEVVVRNIEVKERNIDGSPIVDFIRIRAGSFMMGYGKSDEALTAVNKPFEIMSIYTTEKIYSDVVNLFKKYLKPENQVIKYFHQNGTSFPIHGPNVPMTYISYFDVSMWLKGLNKLSKINNNEIHEVLKKIFPGHNKDAYYRLPTDEEWELTAQLGGVAEGDFSHDGTGGVISDYVVYKKIGEIQNVGTKKPVFYDGKPIYDMQGNVWAMTSSLYQQMVSLGGGAWVRGAVSNTHHVLRGLSWFNAIEDFTSGLRAGASTEESKAYSGFRLVRAIK
jgi:formylglycine-generating enzyme required for sulfatase activity